MSDFLTIEQAIPAFDPAGRHRLVGPDEALAIPAVGMAVLSPSRLPAGPVHEQASPATRIAHLLAERAHRQRAPDGDRARTGGGGISQRLLRCRDPAVGSSGRADRLHVD